MVSRAVQRGLLMDADHVYRVNSWRITMVLMPALTTGDDSYRFSAVCKDFRESFLHLTASSDPIQCSLRGVDPVPDQPNERLAIERMLAITSFLETAACSRCYSRQWARQPVDAVFAALKQVPSLMQSPVHPDASANTNDDSDDVRMRQKMNVMWVHIKERVDSACTALATAQRKHASYSGPHTVRTLNSSAHPIRSKHVGVLR